MARGSRTCQSPQGPPCPSQSSPAAHPSLEFLQIGVCPHPRNGVTAARAVRTQGWWPACASRADWQRCPRAPPPVRPRAAPGRPNPFPSGCSPIPSLPGSGSPSELICLPPPLLSSESLRSPSKKLQKNDHGFSSPVPRSGLCRDQAKGV